MFQSGEASLDARLSNHILAREVVRLLKQLDVVTSDRRFPEHMSSSMARNLTNLD